MWTVHDHPGSLERNQPAADHRIKLGQNGFDSLLRLDAFDHDREIGRKLEEPVGVNLGARSKCHDPAERGCTRVLLLSQKFDDLLIERLAIELVALSDVNPHENALALESVHTVVLPEAPTSSVAPRLAGPQAGRGRARIRRTSR